LLARDLKELLPRIPICFIDGDAGVLAYRGIDIHELA
jgi:hypothetical protein